MADLREAAGVVKRLPKSWSSLAHEQAGLLARRQLIHLGFAPHYADRQVAADRWQVVSDVVVCTTTGTLTREQLMWAGVLHAGPASAIGGVAAPSRAGRGDGDAGESTGGPGGARS